MDSQNLYTTKLSPHSQTIRLLRLLPRRSDALESDIHCELHRCSLSDSKGLYRALSYTWAGGEVTGPPPRVFCNMVAVTVTRNLYEALHRLRGSQDSADLWVDSLCINQADDEERTHQVTLMRDIYKNCSEVIIWLGAGRLGNSSGLEYVRFYGDERDVPKLQHHMRYLSDGKRTVPRRAKDFYGAFCLLSMLAQGLVASQILCLRNVKYASSTISGLDAILDRPWVRLLHCSLGRLPGLGYTLHQIGD